METHVWRWAGATSVVLAVAYLSVGDTAREVVWLAVLVGTCVAIASGVRAHPRGCRHPFVLLLASFVVITASYALRLPSSGTMSSGRVADLLLLIAYPLVSIAVLTLVRLQAPGGDKEGAIDGAIVLIAVATLLAGTVFDAAALGGDGGSLGRIVAIVAPLLLSAVAAAAFRLLFVGSSRVPSAWFFVLAALGALSGNVLRSLGTADGTYQRGTWIDLLILSAYVFVALACLHPSMSALTRPSEPGSRRLTLARLLVLAAALLAAPATLILQDRGLGLSLPIVSSVVLSLLVLWRLARLVLERESVRRALQEHARRQEALVEIGRHALDEGDLDGLYAQVLRSCRASLGLRSCAIVPPDRAPDDPDAVVVEVGDVGSLVAVRDGPWSDEDRLFLRAAANVLTGAVRRHVDQETVRHQAVHDALTGLPNRTLIVDRIDRALARTTRSGGNVALLFMDLDGFKQVNDVYGHQAGDTVLVEVASRLAAHVRHADTVGRLAGDEFVVVCDGADARTGEEVAHRILDAIAEPFELPSATVRLTASVGMAVSCDEACDAEQLLANADVALYQAKEQIGSVLVAFDQDVGRARDRRHHLELDLASALDARQFRLVYQPLFALGAAAAAGARGAAGASGEAPAGEPGAGRVVGAEALLRWDHPVHGAVPPAEFIPLADATGFIGPLGEWVIREAAEQLAACSVAVPDGTRFTMWVNLSARQLTDPALPDRIVAILDEVGVPASRFGCEVTEGSILGGVAIPVVAALRARGLQVALDDFGTGFSSLQHLQQLTLDALKIDRSFVDGVAEGGGDRAIVRAVTALARELGVDVVGEGVENAQQLSALRELGCDLVQGYLLGRPAAPEDLMALLAGGHATAQPMVAAPQE